MSIGYLLFARAFASCADDSGGVKTAINPVRTARPSDIGWGFSQAERRHFVRRVAS
jgi:hypothetical protein